MNTKRRFRYFRPGDLAGLERELNEQSSLGWQAEKPSRFIQRYRREDGAFVHRISCCDAPQEGTEARSYFAACERAGWTAGPRRGIWTVFRKPAQNAEPDERLPQDREPVKELFDRRIRRLESLRRWMLVPAAGLVIAGYASASRPVSLCSILPLGIALFVSFRIKFLEEGLKK